MRLARPPRLLALALIACSVALGACGGDDDDEASLADFGDGASEICMDADERIEALEEAETLEEVAGVIGETRTITEEVIADLEELELPSDADDRGQAEEFVEQFKTLPALLDPIEAAAAAGDQEAFDAANEALTAAGDQNDELAREIGADGCVDDDEDSGGE